MNRHGRGGEGGTCPRDGSIVGGRGGLILSPGGWAWSSLRKVNFLRVTLGDGTGYSRKSGNRGKTSWSNLEGETDAEWEEHIHGR